METIETEDIVRALSDPAFYPHAPATVEHVQTHISHVFLAGPYVYKLKKAVRFPFLDYSTAERRQQACEDEVRLNRRLAAPVYLGVVPITQREPHGPTLSLGGPGPVVAHAVWMRRLPMQRMLHALIDLDQATPAMLGELARRLATFHATCPSGAAVSAYADPGALATAWEQNLSEASAFVGSLLGRAELERLRLLGPSFITRHGPLLRARQQDGRIREGHGDLHAEHVCFVDRPLPAAGDVPPLPAGLYVFDCIEFSTAFRCADVAAEIAFLTMDLEHLGRPDLARAFADAYIAATDDVAIRQLLPFYACHRACVRGKVEGLASREPEVEPADRARAAASAQRHFALAGRLAWRALGPLVIATTGLSGTGKTTLAVGIARATGYAHLRSDVLRKRRAGLAIDAPAPPDRTADLYAPTARASVYEELVAEAERALLADGGAIVDATFLARADRQRLAIMAASHGAMLIFLACRSAEAVVRARLARRLPGTSDADWDTHLRQRLALEPFDPAEPYLEVPTDGEAASVTDLALGRVWEWCLRAVSEHEG